MVHRRGRPNLVGLAARAGTDARTRLYTYPMDPHTDAYSKLPLPYRFNPAEERPDDRWEKIYESTHGHPFTDRHFARYAIETEDGGLSWSALTIC